MTKQPQDDGIWLVTRLVAVAVIPFLILAFIILYFFPQLSGERFAWQIKPSLTAIYMGAGYLGGSYLFFHAALGRRWHRVAAGFPGISAFTLVMLLATVLHWDRFDLRHFPFQLWLGLYLVTPMLVPWLWWHNRRRDAGTPEPDDATVPAWVQWAVRALGVGIILMALAGLFVPSFLIAVWPWSLTPLTARVLAGWGALLGVGNFAIAADRRWSAWRVGLESISIWHALFLAGAASHAQDFSGGQWLNWHTLSVLGLLVSIGVFYVSMEFTRRQRIRRIASSGLTMASG